MADYEETINKAKEAWRIWAEVSMVAATCLAIVTAIRKETSVEQVSVP